MQTKVSLPRPPQIRMLICHAYEHGELERVNKIVQTNSTHEWCGMNFHSVRNKEEIKMFIKGLLNMFIGQVTIYLSSYPFIG